MQVEKTAFISYRRTNLYMARAVYQDLTAHGYDVFLDYENIDAGSFQQVILNQIAARAHFIVILTPSALERCNEPGDMVRREIEYALEMKRNIVPLMFDQFNFKDVQPYLTGKLSALPQYNALEIPPAYFEEAMERLRVRFLNQSLDVILHPTPKAEEAAVQRSQANEAAQPAVSEAQLTAEQWLERGTKLNDNSDEELDCYSEAIALNSSYADAYYNRGTVHNARGEADAAMNDFDEAIRLNPQHTNAYYNRGIVHDSKGEAEAALRDYSEAIRLNPQYVEAYNNRGLARRVTGDLEGALADYNEAIRLNPQTPSPYRNRGHIYEMMGDLGRANAEYQTYIDHGGRESEKAKQWIRDNEAKMK